MRLRGVAAVAATAMIVVLGCSTAASPLPSASEAPPASQAASPSPTGPDTNASGTLTVWTYLLTEGQLKALDIYAKTFNAKYPNVQVNYIYVPYDTFTTKVLSSASSSEGPDVMLINGVFLPAFVAAGAVADMTAYWNTLRGNDLFAPASVQGVDGKVHGAQSYVNLLGLWYNQDILTKVGAKPPTNVAELETALAAVTAAGYTGIAFSGKPTPEGEFNAQPWFAAEGVGYDNIDDPNLEKVLARFEDWGKKGYYPRDVAAWGQYDAFQQWLTGKVAFTENGNWNIPQAASDAKFAYGVSPMPSGSSGVAVNLGGETEVIGGFSKQPDLAWAFLEATLFSKDGQIVALKEMGGIPTRSDAAADPNIAANAILAAFASEVATGVPLPAGDKFSAAQQAFAEGWSAVLANQSDAAAAAATIIEKVKAALQ
jgi:multiple sugar transport system substrate-binding protein